MDLKDLKDDKQDSVVRIAVCAGAALLLYGALEKLGESGSLSALEPYLPWLKENKEKAIAVIAAVLFGLSLALWPSGKKEEPPHDPCSGYERVGNER